MAPERAYLALLAVAGAALAAASVASSSASSAFTVDPGQTVLLAKQTQDEWLQARREPRPPLLTRRLLLEAHEGRSSARRPSAPVMFVTCRSRRSSTSSASTGSRRSSTGARSRSTTSSRSSSAARTTSRTSTRRRRRYPRAGFHVKDKLENKLHDLVCAGQITLRQAQRQIAANWQALYKKAFGVTP